MASQAARIEASAAPLGTAALHGALRRAGRAAIAAIPIVAGASSVLAQSDATTAAAAQPPRAAPDPSESDDITPAQPPSSTLQELDAGAPVVGSEIWRDPFGELGRASRDLEKSTGLKIGFAYTALFQQVFGGAGDPSGAGGDVDLLMKWTLLGRDTKDPGALVVNAEYRHEIGDQPPSVLAGEIGAAIPTTNGFGERPIVVKEAYWSQRLFDGALRLEREAHHGRSLHARRGGHARGLARGLVDLLRLDLQRRCRCRRRRYDPLARRRVLGAPTPDQHGEPDEHARGCERGWERGHADKVTSPA